MEVLHKRTGELSVFDYELEMDESPRLAVVLDRISTPPGWRIPPDGETSTGATHREIGPEELDPEAAEQLSHRFLKRLETGTVQTAQDPVAFPGTRGAFSGGPGHSSASRTGTPPGGGLARGTAGRDGRPSGPGGRNPGLLGRPPGAIPDAAASPG